MKRLFILLACGSAMLHASTFTTIVVDGTTSLLDGSTLTPGTTYYAAFELTGGDASDSSAGISGFDFGGGALDTIDTVYTAGMFAVEPDEVDLDVTSASGYSQYAAPFIAGSKYAFTVQLTGVYGGGTPDAFSFQLYDSSVSTLLYEQDLAILGTTSDTPEPGTWGLVLFAVILLLKRRLGFLESISRKLIRAPLLKEEVITA